MNPAPARLATKQPGNLVCPQSGLGDFSLDFGYNLAIVRLPYFRRKAGV
jgi:hypothetical protein